MKTPHHHSAFHPLRAGDRSRSDRLRGQWQGAPDRDQAAESQP
jgi:hypothetical protein